MTWRRTDSVRWLAAATLLLAGSGFLVPRPASGAGFGIFEQGTKAMGMAGAFTAQADDPSALFHNAGGLAFMNDSEIAVGTTWFRATEAKLDGANPFPGSGYHAEQEKLSIFLPHAYYVAPINDTWKWGIGLEAPFGLTTEWENPRQFAGRFISTKAALRALDVNPTIGWQVNPNFGLGLGFIARFSDVELNRDIPQPNPFTQTVSDIGRVHLTSDFERAYGFNVGLLHKVTPRFSWGLSYRSKMTVDYEGDARLTQHLTGNAQFDALIASRLPFNTNLPVKTSIDFPDMASLGFAYKLTRNLLVETDINWTGWSEFQEVVIEGDSATAAAVFGPNTTNPAQARGTVVPEEWDDAYNYRLGVRWSTGPVTEWRFGYVYDETPQPTQAMSPLLPDANRNGFTVGYGKDGPGLNWDVAVMYLKFDERSRTSSFAGEGPFFGTYNTTAWLTAVTVGWK